MTRVLCAKFLNLTYTNIYDILVYVPKTNRGVKKVEAFFRISASTGCVFELRKRLPLVHGVQKVYPIISGLCDLCVLTEAERLEDLPEIRKEIENMRMYDEQRKVDRLLVDHLAVEIIRSEKNTKGAPLYR